MRIAAWLYYLIDRRIGRPSRFDRLYRMHRDPFGYEIFAYEQNKNAEVVNLLSRRHYKHILDIGCGSGLLTRMLAPLADRITAIDFSSEAIDRARADGKMPGHVHFARADIRTLQFDSAYDLIFCSEVLYYLTAQELEDIVRRMAGVLEPGTELMAVCKLSNTTIPAVLKKYAREVARYDRPDNRRPYSIFKFQF